MASLATIASHRSNCRYRQARYPSTSRLSGEALLATQPEPSWHVIGTGDYNGAEQNDILLQKDNGQAAIWLMSSFCLPSGKCRRGQPCPFRRGVSFASSLEPAAMVPTVVEIHQIFFVARSTRVPGARFGVAGGLAFGGGSQQALGTWDAEC